jgi:hypothetical protein
VHGVFSGTLKKKLGLTLASANNTIIRHRCRRGLPLHPRIKKFSKLVHGIGCWLLQVNSNILLRRKGPGIARSRADTSHSLQSCSRAADHYNRHKCHGGGGGGGRDRRYPAFLPRRRSSSAVLASIRGFASRVLVLRSTVASARWGAATPAHAGQTAWAAAKAAGLPDSPTACTRS